jgi:fucose 4-O-acetylase-like acetyltransferase
MQLPLKNPDNFTARETWIDYSKTFGIALVILGHFRNEPFVSSFIFSFHIPLFFLISGYLHKRPQSVRTGIKKDAKKLLVPYAYFYVITYVFWFFASFLPDKQNYAGGFWTDGVFKPIAGLLLGVGYPTSISYSINHPLWFLVALFFVRVIFIVLEQVFNGNKFFIGLVVFALIFPVYVLKINNIDLLFSIDSAIVALPFFYLGNIVKSHYRFAPISKSNIVNASLFIITAVLVFSLVKINGNVEINHLVWGKYLALFYITGILGTCMVVFFSAIFANYQNKIIGYISANTLIIMCIQGVAKALIFLFLTKIVKYKMPPVFLVTEAVCFAVLTLFVCLGAVYIINNYFPFLTGKSIKQETKSTLHPV